MRSLFLRWGVAVVVGPLWGAMLSPRSPGINGAKASSPVCDAARYAQPMKTARSVAASAHNPMNL
jgi:hypothetical protein